MSAVLMQWSDAFNTGIKEVDEQHQNLVRMLNQLNTAIVERRGSQICREILNQLADYTQTHFQLEESLMRSSHYSAFEAHKKQHEDLLAQVVALQAKLDQGKTAISFELLHFLQVWLTKHINESDKRFGQFFLIAGDQQLYAQWTTEVKETIDKRKAWWKLW